MNLNIHRSKRLLLLIVVLGFFLHHSWALDNTPMVYSLPKTDFLVEVQTEKTTEKPGVFYKYSERYLGKSEVITKEKSTFKLKSITVKTRTSPDTRRTYNFLPYKNSEAVKLCVNNQGIICGVNLDMPLRKVVSENKSDNTVKSENSSTYENLLPLGEEFMMAGSEAKLAEGAAKQIYRLRERKLNLITGDVEHLPADGSTLKAMLTEMEKMEQSLTELFVGKSTTEINTQTLVVSPVAAMNNQLLFRLSALTGIVSTDDLSGTPYYISFIIGTMPTISSEVKQKADKDGLYYVIPAPTQLIISDGVKQLYSSQFLIPQLGKTIPISEQWYKRPQSKIELDEETGRLIKIE
jgi:Domain of unknown function (DUF4831)